MNAAVFPVDVLKVARGLYACRTCSPVAAVDDAARALHSSAGVGMARTMAVALLALHVRAQARDAARAGEEIVEHATDGSHRADVLALFDTVIADEEREMGRAS